LNILVVISLTSVSAKGFFEKLFIISINPVLNNLIMSILYFFSKMDSIIIKVLKRTLSFDSLITNSYNRLAKSNFSNTVT